MYSSLLGNICALENIYPPPPSPAPAPNIRGRLADTEFWPYIIILLILPTLYSAHTCPTPLLSQLQNVTLCS